jgi:thiamine-monophosphate kinase
MASASGVRIVIEEAALLADPVLCDVADALGQRASDLALYGGEDYAIVIASDVDVAGFRRIGSVRVGSGVALASCDGLRELEPKGFDHFG